MYWEHPDPPIDLPPPRRAVTVVLGDSISPTDLCHCSICKGRYYTVNERKPNHKFLVTCKDCQSRFHTDDPHANWCGVCK